MSSFHPPRKILITGAYCTGKSTLISTLAAQMEAAGFRSRVVGDVARTCPLPLNREQTVGASAWLIGEQIRAEAEASSGEADVVLCDRGIPDILSHTARYPASTPSDQLYADVCLQIGMAWSRTYDLVFWSRIDESRSIMPDGLRVVDEIYRRDLERSLEEVLKMLSLKSLVLPNNDVERVSFTVRSLRRNLL